jgi:hypothetical protein
MKINITLLIAIMHALVTTCFSQSLHGTHTNDPVGYFRSVYEMSIVQKLLKLEADLNNDGRLDVLLGHIDNDPDSGLTPDDEIGWWVFIAQASGGYVLAGQKGEDGTVVDSVPSFKRDQYKIGLIPELNKFGLLYLSCGRGGQAKCQLKAIVIDGDAWKGIAIGEPVNAEQNYDRLAERFTDPPTPAVQELNP